MNDTNRLCPPSDHLGYVLKLNGKAYDQSGTYPSSIDLDMKIEGLNAALARETASFVSEMINEITLLIARLTSEICDVHGNPEEVVAQINEKKAAVRAALGL